MSPTKKRYSLRYNHFRRFLTIDILINDAGNAHGMDAIDEGNIDDWDAMLDINVKGLLYVSKAILPKMIARKSGQIINIGSTAGKEVYQRQRLLRQQTRR